MQYTILSQEGVEGITFWRAGFGEAAMVNQEGKMSEPLKTYSSSLKINIVKMFPEGQVKIKFILRVERTWLRPGFWGAKYRYAETNGRVSFPRSVAYQILMKDDPRGFLSLYINTATPLMEATPGDYGYAIGFDEPWPGSKKP